jgi:hypothetical protein
MENFIKIFSMDFKRSLDKKKLIILVLIFLLTIFIAKQALNDYKKTLSNIKNFQNLNISNFNNLIKDYTHYSLYGIKCFFVPSPLGKLLKTTGSASELSARVDSIVSIDLFINAKGRSLFVEDSTSPFRLSFIILVLLILSVLYLGYESIRDKEFIKIISSILSNVKIFIYIVLSRIILLTLIMVGFFAILSIMIKLKGFNLSNGVASGLFSYFFSAWIMLIIFFLIGVLVGNIKKKGNSITVLISMWFIFVFFLPGLLDSYIYKKSKNITSSYKVEFEQLEIVNNFEKRSFKEVGKFSKEKIYKFRELSEYYLNSIYIRIVELEENLKNEISSITEINRKLAILSPVTFFKLTGNEVSSMGFENILKFYSFLQVLKRQFLVFWLDRVNYNDPKELVSFIKGDENLYYAHSQLPGNFGIGVLINMGYIIILLFASYFRFKKAMFPIPKEIEATNNVNIQLEKGKINIVHGEHPEFFKCFTNALFGKTKSFKGKITIDGKDIETMMEKPFLYMTHPDNIPDDIKTSDLMRLYKRLLKISKKEFNELKTNVGKEILKKRFADLKITDKANILLLIAELNKCKIYVFYNFAVDLPKNFRIDLPERVDQLIHEDTMVIDLVSKGDIWTSSEKYININMKNKKYYVATDISKSVRY